jgi:tetratricopeptide (TPR) repeat protein
MKNIKASIFIAATLIATCCHAASAADPKANLSHQDILTRLLTAELALQRDMPDVALNNYMTVAKYTQDPEVAQLATELAIQLQNADMAISAAEIWAHAAKDDLQPQLVALTLLASSDLNKTTKYLTAAFNTKAPDIDQSLLLIISKISSVGQKNLTTAMNTVADQQKTNPYAQLAAAQLAAAQLDIGPATKRVTQALNLKPDMTSAIELKAKLIRHEHNDDKPALVYLEKTVGTYPKDNELRMFYVTALMDNDMTDKAIPQLQKMNDDKSYGGQARIKLGEIYILKSNYAQAEATFTKALKYDDSADKANYYLGQLAEYNNNNPKAIAAYENVSDQSEYHVQAYLRAANLYSAAGDYDKALDTLQNSSPATFLDQKQILLTEVDVLIESNNYDQALDNCNTVISVLPDDVDFLYARSIVYSLMKNTAAAEKDLRAILVTEPNNANALNALGFTLSNQPNRISEALPLLQKAMSLNPDNPAFMDSMGWLLFRMGKYQDSIDMLGKAYKLSGDNEIAAHYGEVLWANGNKDAAKSVWSKALATSSIHQQAIHDTLVRLNVPLADLQPAATKQKTSKVKAEN